MAIKMKDFVYQFAILILYHVICGTDARIHSLKIQNDGRKQIDMTTFGFLRGGYLSVTLSKFQFSKTSDKDLKTIKFGFTLDKTISTGISPYFESRQESCILEDQNLGEDRSVSVVFFKLDLANKVVKIEKKGDDLQNLDVSDMTVPQFNKLHPSRSRRSVTERFLDKSSDSFLIQTRRRKRDAAESTTKQSVSTPAPVAIKATQPPWNRTTTLLPINVSVNRDHLPITYKDGKYSFHFLVSILHAKEEGLYNLYFHNCYNYGDRKSTVKVNFTADIVENNHDNYLSAGDIPLPTLYISLSVLFFFAGCFWLYVLRKSKETVFKIHYLMLVVCYVKSIALLFHAINNMYISKVGYHEASIAVLYYVSHLMKGALLFITIVLIGAGWAFVKHILSDRDKKIFIIVIPLQILSNVAQIIIEETEEGQSQYTTWKEILVLVDLLCCGAILFPVVWSIRHLQEASQTDGKAAINLVKLKIFRHFYIMIVCYIYFTRIIVYLLQITVPFNYTWLHELFKEIATFFFFVVTGYKFRPASNNPYLQLSTEEDDMEMDEVVTQSGAYENLVKVNVKTSGSTTKQRESSHEYD